MASPLPFSVQPSSGVPIYRQIVEQVEALVAGGTLQPGTTLPSVRTVAAELAINPMTVSKAYGQLEAAGLVQRLRGRGMQVCQSAAGSNEPVTVRTEALRPQADALAVRARQLGLNQTQTLEVVRQAFREADPVVSPAPTHPPVDSQPRAADSHPADTTT